MFEGAVTLRGGEGAIVCGYRTAAVVKSWTVYRTAAKDGAAVVWTLRAIVARADPFTLRHQGPLKFTAPRIGGYFTWPILGVTLEASSLAAQLGPPEA
jgi:hypothetical protein